MSTIASQITSLTIVYSTVYSGADQSKHQSSASLAFVWGIHRGPVNSPHKWPVTRKMFPFDDVIMSSMGWAPVECISGDYCPASLVYVIWIGAEKPSLEPTLTYHPLKLQWRHNGRAAVSNQPFCLGINMHIDELMVSQSQFISWHSNYYANSYVFVDVLLVPQRFRITITVTSHERHDVSNHRQLDCLFTSLLSLYQENLKALHYSQYWSV